jgi:hypothetical protein
MAYLRVATALVEERSAASKSAASTSNRHSRRRSNRPAHSKLPTIQEEVNQPRANTAQGGDLRTNLDKNRCGRDARGYIDQRHRECEEWELRRRLDYDREYDPRAPSIASWSVKSAITTTSRTDDVPSTRQTTTTLRVWSVARISSPGPRSQVMAPAQDEGASQVGDNVDDMSITTFPALAPHLRSITYPNNFKLKI